MGFIIYSIIVQFGWKSRECSSAVGTKLAPHRYTQCVSTPCCLNTPSLFSDGLNDRDIV